jgi:hypothetical protein
MAAFIGAALLPPVRACHLRNGAARSENSDRASQELLSDLFVVRAGVRQTADNVPYAVGNRSPD